MVRRFLPLAALCLLGAGEPGAPVTIADLDKLADVADPVFTADGRTLVYDLTTRNTRIDAKVADLWSVSWDGGAPRQLTRTERSSEWLPAPTPDGKSLYFLSDAAKDKTVQLWVMPLGGGAARQVTHMPDGISDFALAPDGKRAVVVAEVDPAAPPKPATGIDAPRSKPPIVIDRFAFRADERGWLTAAADQLHLVDLASGKAQQLTRSGTNVGMPSWSPDGRSIAYVSYRDDAADRIGDSGIFVIAAQAGASPRELSTANGADNDPSGDLQRPAWSPDSSRLAWTTSAEPKWIYYSPHQLSIGDVATGTVREVARIDRWTSTPRWSSDGKHVLALIEEDRSTRLASVDADTGSLRYLSDGEHVVSDYAVGPQDRIAALQGSDARPDELQRLGDGSRTLTSHNGWVAMRQLGEVRDIAFRSADGTEIHGLLTMPPPGIVPPGAKPPLMVRVHGGPVSQFDHQFSSEWQIYAARGYAVLAVNPRGSSGRGFDFSRAIYADWGNKDAADVSAGISWVLDQGLADPKRIAVGGWSYGGILTDYLIASDPRIGAAVSGAGVANVSALWGVDQYIREYEQELGTPWDNPETYARLSYPFLKAGRITAPTLFLCAEADLNVPCAGAQQMYQALRTRGVPTRLVVYPGAFHSLSAPSHIRDRIERSLDWYQRHLTAK